MNTTTQKPKQETAAPVSQGEVMVAQGGVPMKLAEEVAARTEQFKASLPAHIPAERFARVLLTAASNNPALVKADRRTFFSSAMKAATDGLLPDGREGALLIYKTKSKEGGQDKWVDAVQWIPMVAGIRKKIRNSGEIADLYAEVVYAADEFDYRLGLDRDLTHKPAFKMAMKDRGAIVAAYSVAKFKDGSMSFDVMSADEIWDVWRKASKQKDKDGNPTGMWRDYLSEAFKKTVVKRHAKQLPMSTDLDDVLRRDDDLYDFEGRGDAARGPKDVTPKRPRLKDFREEPATNEDDTKPEPEAVAQKKQEHVDRETGEVTEDQQQEDDYSAADAYREGSEARVGGKARKVPSNLTAFPNLAEAWTEGFDAGQEEEA